MNIRIIMHNSMASCIVCELLLATWWSMQVANWHRR